MKRPTYEQRIAQIRPLHEQGMSYTKIAKAIGVASSSMSGIMRKAIDNGDLKHNRAPSLRHSSVKLGSLSAALEGQSAEFKNWLITETRGNITVAELAISIMVDVFHEEMEQ